MIMSGVVRRAVMVLVCGLCFVAGFTLVTGCTGQIQKTLEEFKSIPLGYACDPNNLPDTLPGCQICQFETGDDFYPCCAAIPEREACVCVDLDGTGIATWYLAFCRLSKDEWGEPRPR